MAFKTDNIMKLAGAGTAIVAGLAVINYYAIQLPKEHKESLAKEAVAVIAQNQANCAKSAKALYESTDHTDFSSYSNHYNAKMNKCFMVVTVTDLDSNFVSIDLYDAVERKAYGNYTGTYMCSGEHAADCRLNSGRIWNDGNNSRLPADVMIGFKGTMYGGGSGNDTTQAEFMTLVQPFMND